MAVFGETKVCCIWQWHPLKVLSHTSKLFEEQARVRIKNLSKLKYLGQVTSQLY